MREFMVVQQGVFADGKQTPCFQIFEIDQDGVAVGPVTDCGINATVGRKAAITQCAQWQRKFGGVNPPYKIMGVKVSGELIDVDTNPYMTPGVCYTAAIETVRTARGGLNPDGLVRVEVRDHEGNPVHGYPNDDPNLLIAIGT